MDNYKRYEVGDTTTFGKLDTVRDLGMIVELYDELGTLRSGMLFRGTGGRFYNVQAWFLTTENGDALSLRYLPQRTQVTVLGYYQPEVD